jgi:hypothetical protein
MRDHEGAEEALGPREGAVSEPIDQPEGAGRRVLSRVAHRRDRTIPVSSNTNGRRG